MKGQSLPAYFKVGAFVVSARVLKSGPLDRNQIVMTGKGIQSNTHNEEKS